MPERRTDNRRDTRSLGNRGDGARTAGAYRGGGAGNRAGSARGGRVAQRPAPAAQVRVTQRQGSSFQPAQKHGLGKFALLLGIVIIVILVLTIAWVALSHSSLMRIERIEAKGVEHLTADEIEQLAAVPDDATLLNVDTERIRENLLKDSWIQSVEISRVPPNTLRIGITERTIRAVVAVPSASAKTVRKWAISSDEVWLMPIPDQDSEAGRAISQNVYDDVAKALQITDVPHSEQPEIGATCKNEYVNCALEVVGGLTTSLADRVQSVRAAETQSVTLVLDNNVQVVFGNAEDIRNKERVVLELLSAHEGEISYINVRSVENPTWRSI